MICHIVMTLLATHHANDNSANSDQRENDNQQHEDGG